jgi:hypothetical protein
VELLDGFVAEHFARFFIFFRKDFPSASVRLKRSPDLIKLVIGLTSTVGRGPRGSRRWRRPGLQSFLGLLSGHKRFRPIAGSGPAWTATHRAIPKIRD